MKQNEYSKLLVDLMKTKDEIQILEDTFETGSIKITIFPITTGIYLSLNEAIGTSIPFDEKAYKYELTTINQCITGRCEFRHPGEAISYISPQLTCIARKRKMDAFYYPIGNYTGLEISIIESLIDEDTRRFLNDFSIDIDYIIDKYLHNTETYIGRTEYFCNILKNCTVCLARRTWEEYALKHLKSLNCLVLKMSSIHLNRITLHQVRHRWQGVHMTSLQRI